MSSLMSEKLLSWYANNKRDLPWRDDPNPYHTWVSEIMAQQTRLETMTPYYQRWMKRFPDVTSLATADQQDVLNLWEGLGYYSRARNLHKAAKLIMHDYGGKLPSEVDQLQKLPGIGPYTAGAIASLAFRQDQPVVDGNVKRVFARLYNLQYEVDSNPGEKSIWALANELLPSGKAADFNQALMDLGSSICLPRRPLCKDCPLAPHCQARIQGTQDELPRRRPKPTIPHHIFTGAVIQHQDTVLITQRPQEGLLGGMWEFPGGKQESGESLRDCLLREIMENLGIYVIVGDELGIFKHGYTHFKVTLHAFECGLNGAYPKPLKVDTLRWVRLPELSDFPMGKINRMISDLLLKHSEYRT